MNKKPRNRFVEYRDLLEQWMKWWYGPGQKSYDGTVLPPLTKTSDAIGCFICAPMPPPGEWCRCCGMENTDTANVKLEWKETIAQTYKAIWDKRNMAAYNRQREGGE